RSIRVIHVLLAITRPSTQIARNMRNWIPLPLLVLAVAPGVAGGVGPATVRVAAAYSASHGGQSFLALQHGQTLFEQSAREPRKYMGPAHSRFFIGCSRRSCTGNRRRIISNAVFCIASASAPSDT